MIVSTKYAVLNPMIGQYEYLDDQQQALDRAHELAWDMYLQHTHNVPISRVETDDQGRETWNGQSCCDP